jgi:hypothetical protein
MKTIAIILMILITGLSFGCIDEETTQTVEVGYEEKIINGETTQTVEVGYEEKIINGETYYTSTNPQWVFPIDSKLCHDDGSCYNEVIGIGYDVDYKDYHYICLSEKETDYFVMLLPLKGHYFGLVSKTKPVEIETLIDAGYTESKIIRVSDDKGSYQLYIDKEKYNGLDSISFPVV